MKIENHYPKLKENLEVIAESIEKGLQNRQQTLGFSLSSASMHILEIILHKNKLISDSFVLKHEWLKSKGTIEDKIPFDFKDKQEIIALIIKIETNRNILCYGKENKGLLAESLECFNKLKALAGGYLDEQ